jgi:hypothetical protein
MGHFANLYVVDATADATGVKISTSVLGAEVGPKAYFSWGSAERPEGLHQYARGTIFSDTKLALLPGYPKTERCGEDADRCLIEADFMPRVREDSVLFHFLLPERFVPRRARPPTYYPTA